MGNPLAADLDGDGDLDLVNGNGGSTQVHLQTEPGVFETLAGTLEFEEPLQSDADWLTQGLGIVTLLRAADLNGDGRLDLVTADRENLRIAFQAPDGTFPSTPTVLPHPQGSTEAFEALPADLDGDGRTEIVVLTAGAEVNAFNFDATSDPTTPPTSVKAKESFLEGEKAITIWKRSGPAQYAQAQVVELEVVGVPRIARPIDVDADGDLDLALAVERDQAGFLAELYWIEQLAGGEFAPAPELLFDFTEPVELSYHLKQVYEFDLDEDGRPDLLTVHDDPTPDTVGTTPFDGEAVLHRRTTSETGIDFEFTADSLDPPGPSLNSLLSAVTFVRADADDRVDMVTEDLRRAFLLRDGVTAFSGELTEFGLTSTYETSPTIVDLDGDGDLDALAANGFSSAGGGVNSLELVERGRSTRDFPESASPLFFSFPSSAARDLDGDGDLDMIASTGNSQGAFDIFGGGLINTDGRLGVALQTAPRTFVSSQSWITEVAGATILTDVADMDGDGDLDLTALVYNTYPGSANFENPEIGETVELDESQIRVYPQTAPGVFSTTPSMAIGGQSQPSGGFETADVDGDGDVDVAMSMHGGLALFLQGPAGQFELTEFAAGAAIVDNSVTVSVSLSVLGDVAIADMDGDGRLDLVSGSFFDDATPYGGRPITITYQTGPATFSSVELPGLSGDPAHLIEAIDVDGDGRRDVFWVDEFGFVQVALQTSPGQFEQRTSSTVELPLGVFDLADYEGVSFPDLDGDGDVDLVMTTLGSFRTLLQTSPGHFDLDRSFGSSGGSLSGPTTGRSADLDGDGELDLIGPGVRWGGGL